MESEPIINFPSDNPAAEIRMLREQARINSDLALRLLDEMKTKMEAKAQRQWWNGFGIGAAVALILALLAHLFGL